VYVRTAIDQIIHTYGRVCTCSSAVGRFCASDRSAELTSYKAWHNALKTDRWSAYAVCSKGTGNTLQRQRKLENYSRITHQAAVPQLVPQCSTYSMLGGHRHTYHRRKRTLAAVRLAPAPVEGLKTSNPVTSAQYPSKILLISDRRRMDTSWRPLLCRCAVGLNWSTVSTTVRARLSGAQCWPLSLCSGSKRSEEAVREPTQLKGCQ
jgi:hypothetical protein